MEGYTLYIKEKVSIYIWLQFDRPILAETNRETFGFGPLLITVLFLALKKTGFSKKKNSSQKKIFFFYLFSMQLFSADATMFSKKKLSFFLTTKS
jgi:hypothetical protein